MDRSTYSSRDAHGFFVEESTKTPGFHKLKRLGVRLPNKPYYWYRMDVKHPRAYTYNGMVSELDAGLPCDPVSFAKSGMDSRGNKMPHNLSNHVAITNARLLNKVRESKIDLGVALGEYRETAAFIVKTMQKTVESLKLLKRGHYDRVLRTLTGRKNDRWNDIPGASADVWLTYTYALRPLLKDVYDACSVLQNRYEGSPPSVTVRSGSSFEWSLKGDPSRAMKADYNLACKVRGAVTFYVDNPVLRTLDQCGVVNPLSVAWELVPYSFVADWFIPIGRFVQEIIPPLGVSVISGYITTKVTGTAVNKTDFANPAPGWHTTAEYSAVEKRRTVLSQFPRYQVVVPDVSLERSQVASGLALLWNNIPKKLGGSLRI